MKIAQFSSTFPPYEAGIGNACYYLSMYLSLLGHDVTVFYPKKGNEDLKNNINSINLRPIKTIFSIGNASLISSLNNLLTGFDVIHLHYPFFGGDFIIARAAKFNNIPLIITYHQDVFGGTYLRKIIFYVYNVIFQKYVFASAKKIIGLSADHLNNSQIKKFLNTKNYTICPNGVDLKRIDASPQINIHKKLSISQGIPIIGFVGALDKSHYFKRVDLLINALARIRGKAHLLIIGDGDLRPYYENLVKNLSMEKFISFIGKVTNEVVPSYLKAIDFLVLPSDDTESFGIVLIEAMACGKPVIASNLSGVRSVVDDQINGLLFKNRSIDDLKNKILFLINNRNIAQKMGNNGRSKVEQNYIWENIAKKIENVYKECL
ncbi:MAG: glycosyltransferase family 4 protein [Patescibacteria group bacterium]